MKATALNHVSVSARDLAVSVRFYTEVFGMELLPTYRFSFPVQYLQLGDVQFHLFQRDTAAPPFHHVGINVDDFAGTYLKAKALGILDQSAYFNGVYELPDGSVQMYLRDPAGNLVEVDWPDVRTLDRSIFPELKRLEDEVPQTAESRRATLFHRRPTASTPV